MTSTVSSARLDDYRQVAPRGAVDLLLRLGERLKGRRLVNVSGSRYRGLTIEVLNRLVPILNDLGIDASWEVTIGTSDFEGVTRTVGRALTGTEQVITDAMVGRLRDVCAENARRLRLDADLVMVHDAAPLLLVESRAGESRWLWRCHDDLSSPQPQLWNVLRPVAQRYDAVIFSDARFAAPLSVPRFVIYPSVDPLSERNRDMSRAEQAQHLDRLRVPRDKPFLLQVGPFRRSHDPLGVINAYRLVKKHHDVRLVLPPDPQTEMNALERGAAIVIHKPLTVGFGIDVAAAMWKGKPVVGSLAGGIRNQVIFGVTGYTVETVEGAAFRIRHLLGNPELIGRMGAAGREHIRRNFLITRHLGDYLALLALLTK